MEDGADSAAVWEAVRMNPGLAVINATIAPSRTNAAFALSSDQFTLDGVEDLYVENDVMDPVGVTVRDLESGNTLELTVIRVLDTLASAGPVPVGFYVSTETLGACPRIRSWRRKPPRNNLFTAIWTLPWSN